MRLVTRLCFKKASYYQKNADISCSSTFYSKDLIKNTIPNHLQTKPIFDYNNMKFGLNNTPHMLEISWDHGKWQNPIIKPFQMLQIHPFNSTLHYAIECYEGLKAYKNKQGIVRLFRPQCNMKRFKSTSVRISLPDFDGNELLAVIQQFLRIEKDWIPDESGNSLYIRPFHFSMQNTLGIKHPSKSNIIVVASPVGAYYASGFNPISITCDPNNIRSAPGGTGSYKVGSNYGPIIKITEQAQKSGHQQILWLFNGKVGEIGTSNIFFVVNRNGKKQIITPLLEDLVLPGVTRDTIINYLRHTGYTVTQKVVMIDEVVDWAKKGDLIQCFGSGTAVIVSPIRNIQYKGTNYKVNINEKLKAGQLTNEIFQNVLGIQEGRIPDPFGWSRIVK